MQTYRTIGKFAVHCQSVVNAENRCTNNRILDWILHWKLNQNRNQQEEETKNTKNTEWLEGEPTTQNLHESITENQTSRIMDQTLTGKIYGSNLKIKMYQQDGEAQCTIFERVNIRDLQSA